MWIIMYYLVILLILFVFLRWIYLIIRPNGSVRRLVARKKSIKTLIVLGSGGHTTEMLRIVRYLDMDRFSPRIYVIADNDSKSEFKIVEIEKWGHDNDDYKVIRIPRSRKVGQSYLTSVFTTLHSVLYSVPVVILNRPDLILCNGPGTCVPICVVSFILKLCYLADTIIIFVESICRVKTLSLTGKILLFFADNIVVQWAELSKMYRRATYVNDIPH